MPLLPRSRISTVSGVSSSVSRRAASSSRIRRQRSPRLGMPCRRDRASGWVVKRNVMEMLLSGFGSVMLMVLTLHSTVNWLLTILSAPEAWSALKTADSAPWGSGRRKFSPSDTVRSSSRRVERWKHRRFAGSSSAGAESSGPGFQPRPHFARPHSGLNSRPQMLIALTLRTTVQTFGRTAEFDG